MTALPETPAQKKSSDAVNESRHDDHSDDDSELHQDGIGEGENSVIKNEKGHEDGHYTEEANTNYSLFSNPARLGEMRQELFDLKDEIELPAEDFEEYFPFVDNVWRKYKLDPKDTEQTIDTFCCRLRPSNQNKTSTPKPPVEGKQQRRKRKREEKTCSMLMKVTYIASPVKKVKISRAVPSDVSHSHDLDYMDQTKRNSAVMDVARREAFRGFLPGSIFWKMQEEPEKMDAAGGKYMKVSDVRNVQYPWRQQNATVTLKAHSGYSQQRTGPRQPKASTATSTPSTPQHKVARPHQPIQQYTPHPPPPPPQPQPQSQPPPPPPPNAYPLPPVLPPGTLNYPELAKDFLKPYLPYVPRIASQARPHITLTWATSLDSRIALMPGVQTAISGPETKAMTHFLRSQHDAILIGVQTAISDNPGLNCRLVGAGGYGGSDRALQPRPIIIDPRGRLQIHPSMRLLKSASEGKGLGPWIVVGPGVKLHPTAVTTLKAHGGEFLQINEIHPDRGLDWESLFSIFHREGIKSIMIEGGGRVLSELLKPRYANCVDSVIITIAPTFFGRGGVEVSPETTYENQQPIPSRLQEVKWQPMGQQDMVLCGKLEKSNVPPRLPGIHEFSQQANHNHPPPLHTHPLQPPQQPQGPLRPSQVPPPHGSHVPTTLQPPIHTIGPAHSLPPIQQNGTGPLPAPPVPGPPSGKSPKFRHYGPPPGPLRH